MDTKTCRVCAAIKTADLFYGTRNACRECVKARSSAWAAARKPLIKERNSVRAKTPLYKEKRRKYYDENRELIQARRAAQPDEVRRKQNRDSKLKRYGINESDYDRMFAEQGGVCKICGSAHSQRKGDLYLYVDHDHTTMHVRGLLCHHCNAGIGHFKDNIHLLTKAASYLNECTHT